MLYFWLSDGAIRSVIYIPVVRICSLYSSGILKCLFLSGKEKNFVYSHLHPAGRVYAPHPKPIGIGFGGSTGKKRIFLDEDFATVTLNHYAADRTYQPGSLCPNQVLLCLCILFAIYMWCCRLL